jgi:hypothetical protein
MACYMDNFTIFYLCCLLCHTGDNKAPVFGMKALMFLERSNAYCVKFAKVVTFADIATHET